MEEERQTSMQRFKGFFRECVRVLRVTKKPTAKEFKVVVMITGIGMLLIGFIGFLITMINQLVFK